MRRALGVVFAVAACAEVRETPARAPRWESDLRPVLEARCATCHAGASPAAGWSVTRYTDALACREATDGGAVASRLRRALDRADHAPFVDARVRRAVDAWIAGGSLARAGLAHDPGFADPRAAAFHGRSLRASRWAPMLDGTRQDACGRCHAGAPTRPPNARPDAASVGATPCTECHRAPGGALACDTCHDSAETWSGDRCLTPRPAGSHARHVVAGDALPQPLACDTCHPTRDRALAAGPHGDGTVDLRFDPSLAGADARYDVATGACAVRCHAATPTTPAPRWRQTERAVTCTGCHETPPRDHWPGPCTACHAETNATGTALTRARLHLNGRVDLGDGSGTCAACHGRDGDPTPIDRTHQAHRGTTLTAPVACGECHEVPATVRAAGHLEDRGAGDVRLGARATARGARPRFEAGTCAAVACHGEGTLGRSDTRVAWSANVGPLGCDGCHDAPPPYPHTAATSCELTTCHGSTFAREGDALRVIDGARSSHIDGRVSAGVP